MSLIKVFSGDEILANALREQLQEAGIETVMRNNNQSNVLPTLSADKPVELFINKPDFTKAEPVIEKFRLSI